MQDVIASARRGDRDALGVLWTTYQPMLLRFLRGIGCGAPEDVTSNVWIDVARGLPSFTGDLSDFKRWLFTIARRRSIDELRRVTRRGEHLDPDAGAGIAATAGAGGDTAEAYDRAASLRRALDLVGTLPRESAEVVLLRVVADLDVAEVATLVGKTEGNVRVIMHRALKKLGERLAEQSGVTEPATVTMNTVP